jgi:hypothetical protein
MRKQVEARFKKGDKVRVIQDTQNILWYPDRMEGINNQDGGKEFTVDGVMVDFLGMENVWLKDSRNISWYSPDNLELVERP